MLTAWTQALLVERDEERARLQSVLEHASLKQRRAEGCPGRRLRSRGHRMRLVGRSGLWRVEKEGEFPTRFAWAVLCC